VEDKRLILLPFLAAPIVAAVFTHCGASQGSPEDPNAADELAGAELYQTYCALCHGDDGEGYAADDANALANDWFLRSVTDDFLERAIVEGHPDTPMAAYGQRLGGPLSDAEVDLLVGFLRGWQDEPSVDVHDQVVRGDPTRGVALYAEHCASCHGDEGQSGSALSLNNPVFLDSASDGQIRYAIEHGRPPTPMPGFSHLGAQAMDDLTALIRSWATEVEDRAAPALDPSAPVVIHPEGDAPDFPELREGRYLPSDVVSRELEAGKRMIILDARAPSDYAQFHIPGAIPSPYYDVDAVMSRLPRDGTWVLAYCGCPHAASGRVMNHLRENGFENTAVIDEGIFHWRDQGYPVVRGNAPGSLADAE